MTLPKAASLARLYEKKYFAIVPTKKFTYSPDINSSAIPSKFNIAVPKTLPLSTNNSGPPRNGPTANNSQPFQRISFQEMQVRKAKGLCFNCDEKFTPNHRCVTKRLLLLQCDTKPPDELDPRDADFVVELETAQNPEESTSKLALNGMNSCSLLGT